MKPASRNFLLSGVTALTAAMMIQACAAQQSSTMPQNSVWQAAEARAVTMEERSISLKDGRTLTYDVGLITVPQNRRAGTPETMQVEFFRFKAKTGAPKNVPPIFILNGGPDHEGLQPYLDDPGYFEYFLERLTELADVVVPGQRGFGTSGDTPCEPPKRLELAELVNPENRYRALGEASKACHDKWLDDGNDVSGLNVAEATADVGDIIMALGYEGAQLRANSFGAHWGMAVMRNHPELITRATLSALEGPDQTYDSPDGVAATMERILSAAEQSPTLKDHLPEGGIINNYQALIAKADAKPIQVEVTVPGTETRQTISLTGRDMRELSRGYSTSVSWRHTLRHWPADLATMLSGEYEDAAQELVDRWARMTMANAAYYGYDCGSGISDIRRKKLMAEEGARLVGDTWKGLDVVCPPWGKDLGTEFQSDFKTDIPTVLVHGTWDMNTPYSNAAKVRTFFNNHHFIEVGKGSHGALREAEEGIKGFRAKEYHWMKTGDWSDLPSRVDLGDVEWSVPSE